MVEEIILVLLNVHCCRGPLDGVSGQCYCRAINIGLDGNPNISMVVCVLPSARKDLYDCIKKLCCIERPGMLMLPATCTSTEFVLILHNLHLHYTTNHSNQSVSQSVNQSINQSINQ